MTELLLTALVLVVAGGAWYLIRVARDVQSDAQLAGDAAEEAPAATERARTAAIEADYAAARERAKNATVDSAIDDWAAARAAADRVRILLHQNRAGGQTSQAAAVRDPQAGAAPRGVDSKG